MADEFIRLLDSNGTWSEFEADWRGQCEKLQEDFDSYAEATFSVIKDLIRNENEKAGVFAFRRDGIFQAMCQLNKAGLPKYKTPVLRVRFITLSPEYDLTEKTMSEYGDILVGLLGEILTVPIGHPELETQHIKFHLRSPADQQFFRALGLGLKKRDVFASIETRGAWLYISRKETEL